MKGKSKTLLKKATGRSATTAPPKESSFSPEEWAELQGYMAGEDAKSLAAAKRAGQKLTREQISEIFRNTPGVREGARLAGTADNRLSRDLVSVEIKLPRSAIDLLQFLDRSRTKKGKPTPVKKLLSQIIIDQVQADIHGIITDPLSYGHYRAIWNSVCDMYRAPQHKIPDSPKPAKKSETEGPF